MKKTILLIGMVVLALGVLGVGAVFAQDDTPPVPYGHGAMMNNGTTGPMHTFMTIEFAKKFGLNVNDVNTRLASGETMYSIALSAGIAAEEFPSMMTEVRAAAMAEAVKANVITQEQADWMLSRGGMQSGNCTGTGPQAVGSGMMGGGYGRGGMMGGWGTQGQVNP